MAKIRRNLVIWLCISIKIVYKDKNFPKNILSLAKLDDKGIVVDFYSKKQKCARGMILCPKFQNILKLWLNSYISIMVKVSILYIICLKLNYSKYLVKNVHNFL